MAIIATQLCLNKRSLAFLLGMVWILCQICMSGTQFIWEPMVLAQLYRDLYNFINIDKINITIAYDDLLQMWVYDHIVMVRLVILKRVQEDLTNITLVCYTSHLGGYSSSQSLEVRKQQMDGLQVANVAWFCYADYAWYDDAHHLAQVRQSHFFQT